MELMKFLGIWLGLTPSAAASSCKTQSKPNAIAGKYSGAAAGNINGTVAILPIPYDLARQIIPKQYPILRDAYQELAPDFPKDMYPAMLQTNIDHDVSQGIIAIPDFSRASITFPFVDRLNDGYTSMIYMESILISASNIVAILGTKAYGMTVGGAKFDPPCDAYGCTNEDCSKRHFAAYDAFHASAGPKISQNYTVTMENPPYPVELFKNITTQPQFSNKLFCDNYIRLYDESKAPFEVAWQKGSVKAVKPYFIEDRTWDDVWGIQLGTHFIERNYKSCKSLQGIDPLKYQ